jgi:arginyl-tRNA synthetase
VTPADLSRAVLCAVRSAVADGELEVVVPSRAVVTPPGPGGSGDYATAIALQLAREAGRPPLDVAEVLRGRLCRADGVADVVVSGPGFLNVRLAEDLAVSALVRRIREDGDRYGNSEEFDGDEPVLLRIPFDIRAEVVADALVRIIGSQGGRVEVEHGEPVTLRPVPAGEDPTPLGADALRWALLHPAGHDRPRISADHLVQRESNPLFRVRYAYARTCALARGAARLDLTPEPGDTAETLSQPLLRALAEYPHALSRAAHHRAPDRLARHLVTTADAFLAVQHTVLPLGDEKPSAAHRARLALAEAAGTVLVGGLSLLGISTPIHL